MATGATLLLDSIVLLQVLELGTARCPADHVQEVNRSNVAMQSRLVLSYIQIVASVPSQPSQRCHVADGGYLAVCFTVLGRMY